MFVSFRLLVAESIQPASAPTELFEVIRMSRAIRRLWYRAFIYQPENISDATAQMDHNAVVLFTIDRLARSPRTTVR